MKAPKFVVMDIYSETCIGCFQQRKDALEAMDDVSELDGKPRLYVLADE